MTKNKNYFKHIAFVACAVLLVAVVFAMAACGANEPSDTDPNKILHTMEFYISELEYEDSDLVSTMYISTQVMESEEISVDELFPGTTEDDLASVFNLVKLYGELDVRIELYYGESLATAVSEYVMLAGDLKVSNQLKCVAFKNDYFNPDIVDWDYDMDKFNDGSSIYGWITDMYLEACFGGLPLTDKTVS